MYTLMNKNTPLIDFEFVEIDIPGQTHTVQEIKEYHRPWFIPDLKTWLWRRHAPRSRAHMMLLFSTLGLTDTKALVDFGKCLALTDTLWVNHNDHYRWENVNLFDNEFDETISRAAFDGESLRYGL